MSFETPAQPSNAIDPNAVFLNASCLDLLMIEAVPLVYRVAEHSPVSGALIQGTADDDDQREAAFRRLEAIGYRVGQGLTERFSRDRPRFADSLDIIKFLCKDLWTLLFRKQVDNLKTNHRGVYVLTDSAFRPFSRMSAQSAAQTSMQAQPFLWFPCGIIRGALAGLGMAATVHAEVSEMPATVFQIKTSPTKS